MPVVLHFGKVFIICNLTYLIIFVVMLARDARKNLIGKPYGYEHFLTHLDGNDGILRYNLAGGDHINSELPLDTKYILLWTGDNPEEGDMYLGKGRQVFIDSKCPVSNCFVTSDRSYLADYTAFEAVVFAGPQVINMARDRLPERRSPKQKYIFGTLESSHNNPYCDATLDLDGFFNWTWTYKMDSDAHWGYIAVRNASRVVVGPNTEMHWITEMDPIGDQLKNKLKSKKRAAAWFVSNCHSKSNREGFVRAVRESLKKFNLQVDIYGDCGQFYCPTNRMTACLKMVEDNYYFYFSFENSFAEDYVTEKLLYPLQHNTVPIVYGGANYTRFMPDGMYLNARVMGAKKLAKTMNEIISDPERYYDFFRFRKYYSFHGREQSADTNDY